VNNDLVAMEKRDEYTSLKVTNADTSGWHRVAGDWRRCNDLSLSLGLIIIGDGHSKQQLSTGRNFSGATTSSRQCELVGSSLV
jgi:hypothetical protein